MALRNGQGQRKKYLTLELSSVSNLLEDMCAIVSEFQSAKIGDQGAIRGGGPGRRVERVQFPKHGRKTGKANTMADLSPHRRLSALPADGLLAPGADNPDRLLSDSRVVALPISSNPTFVTLPSFKLFFFNSLTNK
jgi:hypothetical protein